MFFTILLFLLILSVLVIAHEWGHYAAARKMGMGVEEFGWGFPPRLFARKGKDGMLWTVNAIPLGGFVRIRGEGIDDRDAPDSFAKKSVPARLFVLLAGVGMNLVVAVVLLSIGFAVGIPGIVEGGVDANATIESQAAMVTDVLPDSPAAQAGITAGDTITSVDGTSYNDATAIREALQHPGDDGKFDIKLLRGGEEQTISVIPAYIASIDRMGIGAGILETGVVRYPWYVAPVKGVEATAQLTSAVVMGMYDLIAGLVTGHGMSADVSGPVGIAKMTGEVARMGFAYLLQFAAMLSINLAVLNALPFPALDGGRVVFVHLEVIRRKPASVKVEAIVHNTGFALLMLLVVLVTYRDIVHLF